MDFASDNTSGVSPEILTALDQVATGFALPYGLDDETLALDERFSEVFETQVRVFPVVSGTAANALALASLSPPWGLILCHEHAHVAVDEAGAPELFSSGARVVGLPGAEGRIDLDALRQVLDHAGHGVHSSVPSVLSLTQATEVGTTYAVEAVAERAQPAREHGLAVHLDGARLANALVALGCSPADATWRAGVDVVSFGATKNGAMDVDAVVFLDPGRVGDFERLRKRGGHLVSKMRYLSAQLRAYLTDDLWLVNARHANAMAARLAQGLAGLPDVELAVPTEANEVFARLSDELAGKLRAEGAQFLTESVDGRPAARLVTSWSTTVDQVDRLLDVAAQRTAR